MLGIIVESSRDQGVISFGPFRLYRRERLLRRDGNTVKLGSRAFDILLALVDRAGEVVGHKDLFTRAWPGVFVEEGSLRFQIAALRKAFDNTEGGTSYISTVPGRGYCFVAPISSEATEDEANDGDVSAHARVSLPPAAGQIVGRDDAVREICARLTEQRFVTVVGPGGMGKTTVAISVAHQLSNDFYGAVCFIELSSISDPGPLVGTVASALGLAVPAQDPTREIIAHLRGKRIVLVFDSCEHLISEVAALCERLLEASRELHIVTTSREALRAEGEYIYRLPPLASPPEKGGLTVAETLAFPAPQLFAARLVSSGQSAELSTDDARLIAEMCRKLGGIALAIELAAGRVGAYGIRQTAQLLDSQFALLWPGRRTAPTRHRTLSATLDWSYKLLSDIERAVFRRLSAFAGSYTLAAALRVAAIDDEGVETFNAFGSLVAKSLVVADVSGKARYRLLDATRTYAIEKLGETGEREIIGHRHADYYLSLLRQGEADMSSRPTADWCSDYASEVDNVRVALNWCFSQAGDQSLGIALTTAAIPLWLRLSLLEECGSRVRQALDVLATLGNPDQGKEMRLQAALGGAATQPYQMAAAYTRVLEIARDLGDLEHERLALRGLYYYNIWINQFQAVLFFAQRFREVAVGSPEEGDQVAGERMLGTAQLLLGDLASARYHLERALARSPATGLVRAAIRFDDAVRLQYEGQVEARVFLAGVLWLQGFVDQAIRMTEENLVEARATGHAHSQCLAVALGSCSLALSIGDLGAAEDYVRLLEDLATENGLLSSWGAWVAKYRRIIALRSGNVTGLRLIDPSEASLQSLTVGMELVDALTKAGRSAEGHALLDEFATRSSELGNFAPEFLRLRGELLLLPTSAVNVATPEELFRHALSVAREQGALMFELRAATSLTRLLRDQGRHAEALSCLSPVYAQFTEGFSTADLIWAREVLESLA